MESCYVVFDTNVLVSAMLSKHSDAATVILVEKMIMGEIIPVYNMEIVNEYNDVLHRRKFNFPVDQIEYLLYFILQFGVVINPRPTEQILIDMKDLPFYEVVMEKRQNDDAYLVTGNIKHFPVEPFIVTPTEMLGILEELKNE